MDQIIIGVDTHKSNHIAVAINSQGVRLDTVTIPTTRKGYHDLEAWACSLGSVKAFGIEGTGSYGAGLSRDLLSKGHTVLDVMRPNRQEQSGTNVAGTAPPTPEANLRRCGLTKVGDENSILGQVLITSQL